MIDIVIGSRGSDLALWQARYVKKRLSELGHNVTINIIKTQGDAIQHLSFDKLEGKGFFTKEIEAALLDGSIDLAVHSHKDLETNPPEGLIIAAVSERADPADILLVRESAVDINKKWGLMEGAIVGTSSARRKSQLLAHRPDTILKDLRGNVPTRINKLRNQQYDAILLAKAGIDRLEIDLSEFNVVVLDPSEFVPAPAQGVLGLQIRKSDDRMAEILKPLNNKSVQKRIAIERKVLNLLEGGCQLPLGVYCDENNTLFASYAHSAESTRVLKTYKLNERINALDMASIVVKDLQDYVSS
ncbi:MAG: hydroxymethylbilane synthase [Crocinitomicaceae bacterium]